MGNDERRLKADGTTSETFQSHFRLRNNNNQRDTTRDLMYTGDKVIAEHMLRSAQLTCSSFNSTHVRVCLLQRRIWQRMDMSFQFFVMWLGVCVVLS